MPPEIKRCFKQCCHYVDNHPVIRSDYEKAFQHQIEILIPCRNIPADALERKVEAEAGFYLGNPYRHAYGTLLPAGGPLVYDYKTGACLREATAADIDKWKYEWERLMSVAKQKA